MSVPASRPTASRSSSRHLLARQGEQPRFRRARAVQQRVVQAAQEGPDEGAGLGRPGGDDLRRAAAIAEDAERVVRLDGRRAGDLRQAALRDQPHQHDLRAAQMAVHQAERHGQVLVGLGGDPGHHRVVPADLDGARDRGAFGDGGQALLHRRRARRQRGAARQDGEQAKQDRAKARGHAAILAMSAADGAARRPSKRHAVTVRRRCCAVCRAFVTGSASHGPARRSAAARRRRSAARRCDASASRSSAARLWTRTARVSKSKGRTISVAGNSFIVSTKTSRPAVSSAAACQRQLHPPHRLAGLARRAPARRRSRLGRMRASPHSTADSATPRKRTR